MFILKQIWPEKKRHLLQSGMDIFYLNKETKKDVRVFIGVFPFIVFFFFFFFLILSKLLILLLKYCFCVAVVFPGTIPNS